MSRHAICHLITGLGTGGAEHALYNLLRGGLADQFDNCVISLGDEGALGAKITEMDIPLLALDLHRGRARAAGLPRLRRFINERRPSVLQGWMYHGNLAAILGRYLGNKRLPVVWNIRQSLYDLDSEKPLTRQVIRAEKMMSRLPASILYNSELSRAQHEQFGYESSTGQVIPNGIDVQRFQFAGTARQALRTGLGIPESAMVIGHIARCHPMKDHATFLNAAAELANQRPDVYFIAAGRDVSPANAALWRLVPEATRERFFLLNERTDIPELMSAMDIFCLSSWSEAFPNVLGEAMAVGLPCAATDVGDCATIIGDTGVLVAPRNPGALAAGFRTLLDEPEETRRLRSARARQRVVDKFGLASAVDAYARLYERLIDSQGVA